MNISQIYRNVGPVVPAPGTQGEVHPQRTPELRNDKPTEFQQILNKQISFSRHAQTRIQSREINWDAALESRIVRGMDSAESKGSREALILADDVAVIANIKSRTVITAMDRSHLKEHIFTNIDSAVLV